MTPPIFSKASIDRDIDGTGCNATDRDTGIRLRARFVAGTGTYLTLRDGLLDDQRLTVIVDGDQLNSVAALLVDGFKTQQSPTRPKLQNR